MKKIICYLKGVANFISGFYFLILLIPLFVQSCEQGKEIMGSFDASHQSHSGPSYSSASTDNSDVGGNFGLMFDFNLIEGLGQHHDKVSGTLNNTPVGKSENLYASNSHGPSAPYYSNEGYAEETTTIEKNKEPSGFVSHLRGKAGIEFVQKRSKDGDTKITLNYLQLPAYLLYYYQLPSAGNIFGGLGPYFAYGIGGKMKSTFSGQTTETKSFDKTTGFKPFDAGLSITAGYKIANSFSFSLAYDYGLVNIDRNAFGDKTKNREISLNISYPLNKIIKKR